MNLKKKFLAVAGLALLLGVAAAAADAPATFNVDPAHSTVSFKIRHFVTKVEGQFKEFSGTITGDQKNPAGASVEFVIKAASIDTRTDKRDAHLRSADFFDVEKYPEITFKSTKIVSKGGDKYDVTGSFTMHGVTKEITLPVTFNGFAKDPWGNTRAGFSLATTLNRKDYGILWNKALDEGGFMLGDDVDITIEIEAVKKADAPAAPGAPPAKK